MPLRGKVEKPRKLQKQVDTQLWAVQLILHTAPAEENRLATEKSAEKASATALAVQQADQVCSMTITFAAYDEQSGVRRLQQMLPMMQTCKWKLLRGT